ncbi:MAG: outer membrane protein TolC [Halioglobus sp.]|jgi:outer membrane protein TolC
MRITLTIFSIISLLTSALAQQSFTLDEAIAYGLENQNSIKMNDIEIANSESEIKEVKAIGLPQINGTVDYSYYFNVPVQPVQDFISPSVYRILEAEGLSTTTQGPLETFELGFVQPQQFNVGLSANMKVFDGSYFYAIRGAKLYRDLIKKQKDATVDQIKANITKAYTSILIADENKKTLADNIKTLEKSLDEVKAMYDAGFMESLDVDRLKLSYDNLNIQLENIEGLIDLSQNLLKFQMGFPLDDKISLKEDINELIVKFDAENQNEIIQIDPNLRAEYQLLNTTQDLNNLNLKRFRAGYLPNVGAFASYQESLQRTNLFDENESGFLPTGVVGLKINVPIYDGGEKSAKIQKVKLDIEKVDLQKTEFTRGMTLQAKNAQIGMSNAKRNLTNRQKALTITQSIYDRTQIKFKEGVGSSVEVTQAENTLYQAQAEVISAMYDLLTAKVDLDITLGKL